MKSTLGLAIALALVALPASAQDVTVDYDHDFDFEKVETFAYAETKDTNAPDQLTDGKIKDAIVKELTQSGLKQVDTDADLFITYHMTSKDNQVLNTTSMGYGGFGPGRRRFGPGPGPGVGMGTSTTTASTYTEGTLIVDAYEPGDKKTVWRGTGTVTVKEKPEKQTKQIENIMTKLGKKWDKILAGKGK